MPEASLDTTPPLAPSTVVVAVQSADWYKSKTLWMAIIGEIITLLKAGDLAALVGGGHAAQIVGTITLALAAILRLVSFAPITGSYGATAAMAAQNAALKVSAQVDSPTLVKKG